MRKSFNAIEPESKEKDPFGLNVQSVHYASYYYCIFFSFINVTLLVNYREVKSLKSKYDSLRKYINTIFIYFFKDLKIIWF